jgi:hypothetical protein
VLVLAILGGLVSGALGAAAFANSRDPAQQITAEASRAIIRDLEKNAPADPALAEYRRELARYERLGLVGLTMMVTGVLGLASGVLAFLRRGKIAAPLLIVPAVAAAVLSLPALVFTSLLIVAGGLSLLIKSGRGLGVGRPAVQAV